MPAESARAREEVRARGGAAGECTPRRPPSSRPPRTVSSSRTPCGGAHDPRATREIGGDAHRERAGDRPPPEQCPRSRALARLRLAPGEEIRGNGGKRTDEIRI